MWGKIGHGLAIVAKYAGKGALWCAENPQIIAEILALTGHPAIAGAINQAAQPASK